MKCPVPRHVPGSRRGREASVDVAELAIGVGDSERTVRSWNQSVVIPFLAGCRTATFRSDDVMRALEKRTYDDRK